MKKKETFIQLVIIGLGLFIGVYFSKISYQEHEKLGHAELQGHQAMSCLLYTSPSPRDATLSRMPSSA